MQNRNSEIELLLKKFHNLYAINSSLESNLFISKKTQKELKLIYSIQADLLSALAVPTIVAEFNEKEKKPGKIVFCNNAFKEFVHDKTENIARKNLVKYFSPKSKKGNPFDSVTLWKKLLRKKYIDILSNLIIEEEKNVNISISLLELFPEKFLLIVFRDLTNEVKYLSKLREEKEKYKTFIENSDSLIYRIEFPEPIPVNLNPREQGKLIFENGYIIECNKRFAENMGFGDPDLLLNKTVAEIFGSPENAKNTHLLNEFIANGFSLRNKIVKQISLGGEEVFFSLNFYGIIKNNKLRQIWGVYYEITELIKIKSELEKSRDEFKTLFEHSPVPMALLNDDFTTAAFNKRMEKAFGYTIKDLPNLYEWYKKPFRSIGDPDVIAKKWARIAYRVRKGKDNIVSERTNVFTKSGELRTVIVSLSAIGNKYLFSVNDITESEKAKLEAETAKAIIENSPNVLLQWEQKGNRNKLIFITKNISLFGYSAEEFLSGKKNFREIILPKCSRRIFKERKSAADAGEKSLKQIYQLKTAKGELRYVESYISVVKEEKNTAYWEIISDVTEKYIAEARLKESIDRYKSVFENSPIGIFHYNANGIIIGFNNQFVESLNSSREKLLGFNLLNQLKNKEVLKLVKNSLRGKKGIYEGPYTSVTSGKNLFVRMILQPILDVNGKVMSVVGLWEDVSERIEARRELEKARDQFRKTAEQLEFILNHINDIVYEQDKTKGFLFVSGSVKKVLGYTPTEFMLNRRKIITDNKINNQIDKMIDLVFKKRKNVRYYVEVYAKNGKKVFLEVSESPIIKEGGVEGLIGVARDITESYKNEQIRETIHQIAVKTYGANTLRELYEFIHASIARFMPAKNIFIAILDPFENKLTFQYYVDQYDNESPGEVVPKNGFTEYIIKTRQNKIFKKEELAKLINKGKFKLIGKLPEAVAVAYLKFSDGKRGVIVLQDYDNPDAYGKEDIEFLKFVSTQIIQSIEKKRAEEELVETNKNLKAAEEVLKKQAEELRISNANKDKLFSIIAHDLRSPFTALLGLTNMLKDMLDEMTKEEIAELVDALNNSATNLFKLLENLLNWSRIQLGTFSLSPNKFSLYETALAVKNYLDDAAKLKKIKISIKIDKKLKVFADQPTIETVIRNLVNNAIKFTREGGKIEISARKRKDEKIEVSIIDNGIGMSEEMQANLFRIDKKVSRKGTNNEAGTGLGLVLVKELVEKNGGEISVKSEENKGTVFTFTLSSQEK